MQVAIIEFARNVCGLTTATAPSSRPSATTPVIALMAVAAATSPTWAAPCGSAPTPRGSAPARARRRPTACPRSASGTATATRSTTPTATCSAEYGLRLSGQSPDGGLVEIDRAAGSPLVHRLPVPPGAQVAADPAASAVRRLHRRGAAAAAGPRQRRAAGPPRRWRKRPVERVVVRDERRSSSPGPCVVEPDDVLPRVAEALARVRRAARGAGLLQGQLRQGQPRPPGGRARARDSTRACAALERVRAATGLPVLTDIHEPARPRRPPRSPTCFRSRRSSAGRPTCSSRPARTGKPVNVKKGQWMPAGGDGRRRSRRCGAAGSRRRRRHRARHVLRLRRPRGGHAQLRAAARRRPARR